MTEFAFFYLEGPASWTDLEKGTWVQVSGPELPCLIRLRLAVGRNGKVKVTTLVAGERGDVDITSDLLRDIPIRRILRELLAEFDPTTPPPNPFEQGIASAEALEAAKYELHDWYIFKDFIDSIPPLPEATEENQHLHEFAEKYRTEKLRNPNRALQAVADALNMSRTTAWRRRKDCQEAGLLPKEDGE